MKKFICGFIVGAMLFTTIGVFAAQYIADTATFKVLVNGEEFVSDPPALVVEGRTYLPLRAMGDALGVPVEWNAELGQAEVGTAPKTEQIQYSRTNPAPVNVSQNYTSVSEWFEDNNYTVDIKVTEIVRGQEAFNALKAGYSLYDEPDEGYEYLNAKIKFSVVSTKGDFSIEPGQGYFKSFTSKNEECPYVSWVSVEPYLTGSLYEGGSTEGWITVMVKKDDAKPKLAYGLDYNGANGVWFALYK